MDLNGVLGITNELAVVQTERYVDKAIARDIEAAQKIAKNTPGVLMIDSASLAVGLFSLIILPEICLQSSILF